MSKFVGMTKVMALEFFSGNFPLMCKTLLELHLHICTDGVIRASGEHAGEENHE